MLFFNQFYQQSVDEVVNHVLFHLPWNVQSGLNVLSNSFCSFLVITNWDCSMVSLVSIGFCLTFFNGLLFFLDFSLLGLLCCFSSLGKMRYFSFLERKKYNFNNKILTGNILTFQLFYLLQPFTVFVKVGVIKLFILIIIIIIMFIMFRECICVVFIGFMFTVSNSTLNRMFDFNKLKNDLIIKFTTMVC